MSRIDYGTVDARVGGEVYTLTPTLECVRKLKRWGLGSVMEALEACRKFDADTIAIVIAAGSGKGQKQLEAIAQAVHDEGTVNVTPPIVEFLSSLLNPTGKDAETEAKVEADTEGEQ